MHSASALAGSLTCHWDMPQACGIIGCFRLLDGIYLLLITKRRYVGSLCGMPSLPQAIHGDVGTCNASADIAHPNAVYKICRIQA